MIRFMVIGLGAMLGANARYWVGIWAASQWGTAFPFGTLLVNLTGSLALGFFFGLTEQRLALPPEYRLFIAVGFLGGYTTFSSYSVESISLLQSGSFQMALLNILGNNLLGLLCAFAGLVLGRMIA
jgi:CrcB protein